MARLRYLQNARTGTAGTISKDTKPIQFYDDAMYIRASADGTLEIVADTSITLTAPTINIATSTVGVFTYPVTITFNCTASSVSDLTITSVSSSTSTSVVIKPLYVNATMSGTNGLGRAIEGKMTVSGKIGDYGNAIKGYTDLTGGTGCVGLVSAVCAEMKMPASTALGTHAVLEIELVMPASAVIQQGIGSNCTSFIRARVSDNSTAVASFNEYGYLLDLQGLTSGSTDLFDGCTLKCAISSTKYYLLLSTATASYTSAYPIALTNTLTTGSSGSGHDINFWGATANQKFFWDASANRVIITHTELLATGGGAYNAGVKITAVNNLALTSNRLCGLSVDINPKAATDAYAIIGAEICTYIASDATVSGDNVIGLFVETQGGTSIAHDWYSLYVYSAPGQAPSGTASVVRLEHNSAVATTNFIEFVNGSTCPTALWTFGPLATDTAWAYTGSLTEGVGGWLKVVVGTATRYIQLYDTV